MQVPELSRPTRRAWLVWGVGAALYFTVVFHRMALGVAGLRAEQRLGFEHDVLAGFTALQFLIYLLMQIPAGLAADRIGPRRTLTAGLAAVAVGELLFAFAHSVPPALAGRALIGFGDAVVLINVLRLAQAWFPSRMGSLLAALTGVVGVLGQLLGTIPLQAALDRFGWTATFAGSSAATVALTVAAFAVIRDRPPGAPAPAADVHAPIGATLKAVWARPGTRQGFWAHLGLMGPLQVLGALWGAPFLIEGQRFHERTAALYLLILSAGFALAGPFVGRIADRSARTQSRMLLLLNATVVATWTAILLWPEVGDVPDALLLAGFALCGVGAAGGMVAFDLGRRENPPEAAGAATAIVNCGGFICGIASMLLAGLILGADPDAARFRVALAPLLCFSALAVVQALRYSRRRERHAAAAAAAAAPAATSVTS